MRISKGGTRWLRACHIIIIKHDYVVVFDFIIFPYIWDNYVIIIMLYQFNTIFDRRIYNSTNINKKNTIFFTPTPCSIHSA